MLSLLSGGIFDGGSAVGAIVGDALVGVGDAAVGGELSVGVTEVRDGCADVDAGVQAAIKITSRTSMII